jgi:hypothetical protein
VQRLPQLIGFLLNIISINNLLLFLASVAHRLHPFHLAVTIFGSYTVNPACREEINYSDSSWLFRFYAGKTFHNKKLPPYSRAFPTLNGEKSKMHHSKQRPAA